MDITRIVLSDTVSQGPSPGLEDQRFPKEETPVLVDKRKSRRVGKHSRAEGKTWVKHPETRRRPRE